MMLKENYGGGMAGSYSRLSPSISQDAYGGYSRVSESAVREPQYRSDLMIAGARVSKSSSYARDDMYSSGVAVRRYAPIMGELPLLQSQPTQRTKARSGAELYQSEFVYSDDTYESVSAVSPNRKRHSTENIHSDSAKVARTSIGSTRVTANESIPPMRVEEIASFDEIDDLTRLPRAEEPTDVQTEVGPLESTSAMMECELSIEEVSSNGDSQAQKHDEDDSNLVDALSANQLAPDEMIQAEQAISNEILIPQEQKNQVQHADEEMIEDEPLVEIEFCPSENDSSEVIASIQLMTPSTESESTDQFRQVSTASIHSHEQREQLAFNQCQDVPQADEALQKDDDDSFINMEDSIDHTTNPAAEEQAQSNHGVMGNDAMESEVSEIPQPDSTFKLETDNGSMPLANHTKRQRPLVNLPIVSEMSDDIEAMTNEIEEERLKSQQRMNDQMGSATALVDDDDAIPLPSEILFGSQSQVKKGKEKNSFVTASSLMISSSQGSFSMTPSSRPSTSVNNEASADAKRLLENPQLLRSFMQTLTDALTIPKHEIDSSSSATSPDLSVIELKNLELHRQIGELQTALARSDQRIHELEQLKLQHETKLRTLQNVHRAELTQKTRDIAILRQQKLTAENRVKVSQ